MHNGCGSISSDVALLAAQVQGIRELCLRPRCVRNFSKVAIQQTQLYDLALRCYSSIMLCYGTDSGIQQQQQFNKENK